MRNLSLRKFQATRLLYRKVNLPGRHLHALLLVAGRTVKTVKQILIQRTLAKLLVGPHLHLLLLVRKPITLTPLQRRYRLRIKLFVFNRLHVVYHPFHLYADKTAATRRVAQQIDMVAGRNK